MKNKSTRPNKDYNRLKSLKYTNIYTTECKADIFASAKYLLYSKW